MRKYLILALGFVLFACNAQKKEIKISSAASLTDVITVISKNYEEKNGSKIQLNFASSSVCAKQIDQGMKADIFLSANLKWSKFLVDKGIVDAQNQKILLHNSLVVIAPLESNLTISDLSELENCKRIATGDVSHVPAGVYAKKTLENVGIYDKLQSKIAGAVDVRAAMSMVESGSVDCGIVYKTDALVSKKAKIIYEIPLDLSPEISYALCLINPDKKDLYEYLSSEEVKSIYAKYGFTPAY